MQIQSVNVFSKKMGKKIQIDIRPSKSIIHASQKTGAGVRMLVSPEPIPSELEKAQKV